MTVRIAIAAAGALLATLPSLASAQAAPPSPAEETLTLVMTVMGTPADALPGLVKSDPRFGRLDADGRARLLLGVGDRENRRPLGVILNCLFPFSIGSFVQGNAARGAWLLAGQFLSIFLIAAASMWLTSAVGGSGSGLDRWSDGLAVGLIVVAGVAFTVLQVASVVFAATFKGERYEVLRRFFDEVGVAAAPAAQAMDGGGRVSPAVAARAVR
jgi:hypothetical protein